MPYVGPSPTSPISHSSNLPHMQNFPHPHALSSSHFSTTSPQPPGSSFEPPISGSQQQQPQGRPGHRRSYSHMHLVAPTSTSFTGASFSTSASSSPSLGNLPRRRTSSGVSYSTPNTSAIECSSPVDAEVGVGGEVGKQAAQSRKFHLRGSNEDSDGDSSEEKPPTRSGAYNHTHNVTHPSTPVRPRLKIRDADNAYPDDMHDSYLIDDDDDDDERELRGFPPLRLKKMLTFNDISSPLPNAGVPFPSRPSPQVSPSHSPVSLSGPSLSSQPSSQQQRQSYGQGQEKRLQAPPMMRRAASESSTLPTTSSLSPPSSVTAPVITVTSPPGINNNANTNINVNTSTTSPPANSTSTNANANIIHRPPPVSRTSSTPIFYHNHTHDYSKPLLLSNGKPLRSSLKSSSSSPNIPGNGSGVHHITFPKQSLVPSIMWPDLHRDRYAYGHQRAASAPSTPMLGVDQQLEEGNPDTVVGARIDTTGSPPSLTSSVSSIASLSASNTSSASSTHTSPTSSPQISPSPSTTTLQPHPPKNVHFPSQDNNLATVRVFNRSARPASLSLSRLGGTGHGGVHAPGMARTTSEGGNSGNTGGGGMTEESQTETETEGEGSGSGGGWFGSGGLWGRWGGYGGYGNGSGNGYGAWAGSGGVKGGSRNVGASPSSNSNASGGSYPFPTRLRSSPLGGIGANANDSESEVKGSQIQNHSQDQRGAEDAVSYTTYAIDQSSSSPVPRKDVQQRVDPDGNVFLESVGFVHDTESKNSGDASFNSTTPKPKKPLMLTGTLLVRNLTYAKTVVVRYTLDEWHTTNDVLATHEKSLVGLPRGFVDPSSSSTPSSSFWSDTSSVRQPYNFDDTPVHTEGAGTTPAWDRFRFFIVMEDYALNAANPLESRTMWLVGRYSAGVDLGAVLSASTSRSPVSGDGGAGVGLTGNGNGVLDEVLSRSNSFESPVSVVPGGTVQEWWDNNGGRNYRIAFRRVNVEVTIERKVQEKVETKTKSYSHGYKRGVAFSAPSPPSVAYNNGSNINGTTSAAKANPAPPQISSSLSYPQQHNAYQTPTQMSQQHREQKEALAHSTLARLRRLNLRNYAAPVSSSSMMSTPTGTATMNAASTTPMSSTASTPVQTPVLDFRSVDISSFNDGVRKDEDGNDNDEDRTPTVYGVARPTWGSSPSMNMEQGYPATSMFSPSGSEMALGTSPPFSDLGGMGMGMRGVGAREGEAWPWSSFGDRVEKMDEGTSLSPTVDAKYDDGGTDAMPNPSSFTRPSRETLERNDSGTPLAPPQRKRKESGNLGARFSIHANEAGSGSDSSSSLSGNGNSKMSHTSQPNHQQSQRPQSPRMLNMGAGPALWGLNLSNNFGFGRAGSGSPRPGSPSAGPGSPRSGPGTRSPLRVSPVNSNSNLSSMSIGGTAGVGIPSPLSSPPFGSSLSIPTPLSPNGPPTPSYPVPPSLPSTAGATSPQMDSDAVYQAFVRQWCFAQAPGPSVGVGDDPRGEGTVTSGERRRPALNATQETDRDFGVVV